MQVVIIHATVMIMPDRITPASTAAHPNRRAWIALVIVCLGQLMIVLDTTIVNVALPAIDKDLHFGHGNLTWVVDAYMIAFGSFLLLAGRMGDLIGRKKIFLSGLALFVAASAWCGLAQTEGMLIGGRFVQGLGGAFASSVILAIIVTEFPAGPARARAMGVFAFTAVSGGSIGLLAGGWLTEHISWHWIFFINLPIGVFAWFAGRALIDESEAIGLDKGVDVLGSLLVTVSVMIGVYGVIEATRHGWGSTTTLGSIGVSLALLLVFLLWEGRIANPIMPLRILRNRGLMGSSAVRALLVTGMFSVFFLGALYFEQIKGYSATETGLAFLPMTLTVAVLSLTVTPRLMGRVGPLPLIVFGLSCMLGALILLSHIGQHTDYYPLIGGAFLLQALGMGTAFMPLLNVAMADVPHAEAGLASGIINVSVQLAAAIGLAVLTTLSTNHANSLLHSGHSVASSLVGGYHLAFAVGAGCVLAGLLIAVAVLRTPGATQPEPVAELEPEPELEPVAA